MGRYYDFGKSLTTNSENAVFFSVNGAMETFKLAGSTDQVLRWVGSGLPGRNDWMF